MQLVHSDISFLGTLPPDVRDDVEQWRDRLLTVTKPVTVSLRRIAAATGVSVKTAARKYYAFKASGCDVRSLVNRAKVPETESNLTPEFLDWFKALAEKNQRKNRPAHRKFCSLWKSGAQIPGLDNSLPRHCLPPGTGYDNIQKVTEMDTGADVFTLVRVSHIHLFGITFIFFLVGIMFCHAYVRPVWFKCAVVAMP